MKIEEMINKIHCADSLAFLKGMPDNSVDLVVTSPPYDNLREYKGYTFDFEGIAKGLFRVLKQGGVIVWVVGDATEDGNESLTSFNITISVPKLYETNFNKIRTQFCSNNLSRRSRVSINTGQQKHPRTRLTKCHGGFLTSASNGSHNGSKG